MERSEGSAWHLAIGGFCVFALAVVFKGLPWQTSFGVLLVVVAAWAFGATPPAGAVLGVIAWAFLTGFDVGGTGELRVTGPADVLRAAALVAAGLAAAYAGRAVQRLTDLRAEATVERDRAPLPVPPPRARVLAAAGNPKKETRNV